MVNLSDIGKRLLLGRKLRSTQLGETLLPKRIALPVFASDALSSVAYAPDEILLTLSLAGLVAYSFSWKIAILVAVVMLVVVASYRQNVHAYPSGGGDYEVATVNLGPNAGLTVASALLVDYVLTVAVSISSGVANAKSLFPFLDGHEALVAAIAALILMALNLRGVRESGTFFAIPTLLLHVRHHRDGRRTGCSRSWSSVNRSWCTARSSGSRPTRSTRRSPGSRWWRCWPGPSPPAARR